MTDSNQEKQARTFGLIPPDMPTSITVRMLKADGAGRVLTPGEELLMGMYFAADLERNAKTDAEWREAFRSWLKSVVRYLQAEHMHPEFLLVAFQLGDCLDELEQGRQPSLLTALATTRQRRRKP